MEYIKVLDDWEIHVVTKNKDTLSEQRLSFFSGFVDNKRVYIWRVRGFDQENEALISSTGMKYKLGKANEKYEKRFPNARQKFIDALSKKNGN